MELPLELTPEEQRPLRRQARQAVGHVAERIHYVLLYARGYAPAQIADLYQVDERTVASWLARYRTGGVAALDDRPRSGRPRRASAAALAEARHCLEQSPTESAGERTTWRHRLLGRHLAERCACCLSASSLTRLIHRLGFVWTRPKLSLQPEDAEAAARAAAIEAAIAAAPARIRR